MAVIVIIAVIAVMDTEDYGIKAGSQCSVNAAGHFVLGSPPSVQSVILFYITYITTPSPHSCLAQLQHLSVDPLVMV